ncbi:MAG: sigma-70 family RNA polymerase sigma factor [Prolixibacteraceae bacterium]|nr:sigma-70 family RNA polymerase sigma factor [Prolixibacteraceae bacterium]
MTTDEFKQHIIPFSGKLYPMINRILKDEEESRDAVQDLMLKLWDRRKELGKCLNLNAYITAAAKNYCFDLLKKKRPLRMGEKEEFKVQNLHSEEKSLELKESHEKVQNIISNLPDRYREVIRMRDIDGFSFDEIKEMTGYEIPYIRVILSRSRLRVKSELLKIYNYEKGSKKQFVDQILQG